MDRETDRIMLRELRLECVIGVGEDERCQPQELLLDLELEVDSSLPGRTDDLADTVDYGALAKRIRSAVGNTTDYLLERLAERIAEMCLEDPRVRATHITLTKPAAIKAARGAGVRIYRVRHA